MQQLVRWIQYLNLMTFEHTFTGSFPKVIISAFAQTVIGQVPMKVMQIAIRYLPR